MIQVRKVMLLYSTAELIKSDAPKTQTENEKINGNKDLISVLYKFINQQRKTKRYRNNTHSWNYCFDMCYTYNFI